MTEPAAFVAPAVYMVRADDLRPGTLIVLPTNPYIAGENPLCTVIEATVVDSLSGGEKHVQLITRDGDGTVWEDLLELHRCVAAFAATIPAETAYIVEPYPGGNFVS